MSKKITIEIDEAHLLTIHEAIEDCKISIEYVDRCPGDTDEDDNKEYLKRLRDITYEIK